MRFSVVFFLSSTITMAIALTMLLPLVLAFIYAESAAFDFAFIVLSLVAISGTCAYLLYKKNKFSEINHREAMSAVAFCWFICSVAGAFPFMLSCDLSFADAFFEACSGFTTTGSTIFKDIEILPKSILFWRSQIQWLGGMGIIVLSLALLPLFNVGAMQLFKAETTGPTADKLAPRLKDTAKILWFSYVLLTLALIFLLSLGDMNLFEAVNHAFSTMATGGFSTKNSSMAAFSAYSQWLVIIFMFIAGINFTLHFRFINKEFNVYQKNTEFLVYFVLTILVSILVFLCIFDDYSSFEEGLRAAFFQVVSIVTTTGFASADYEIWPYLAQALIFFALIVGSCTGSTSGGVKMMRLAIVFAFVKQEIVKIIHPHSVSHVKLESKKIPQNVMNSVLAFIFLYAALAVFGTIFICFTGQDILSALSASITALSNVGPGFGTVGPVENFAHFSDSAKYVLSILMIMGRLEIFTIFVLFVPDFWRR